MAEYIKELPGLPEKLFLYSDHHGMTEMTESKLSGDEVLSPICISLNHTTGNFFAGISGGLTGKVIPFFVYHKGTTDDIFQ